MFQDDHARVYWFTAKTASGHTFTFARMLQELNEKRVTLMEGTALSERDLQRSRAESASAVFLLADRFSPNYQQEDLNVQFQVQHNS